MFEAKGFENIVNLRSRLPSKRALRISASSCTDILEISMTKSAHELKGSNKSFFSSIAFSNDNFLLENGCRRRI